MRRSKNKSTMTELLRQAIAEADTLLGIERDTGVKRAALRRFRDGEQSLRLDIADRLAAYFGIQVCRKDRR
jgi:plasmid maintenance system antidote protein VapI